MAYSINPNLPKARRTAVMMVVCDRLPIAVVARKCGINRSTVYRWLKRWQEINEHRDGNWRKGLRGLNYYKFIIPTRSSRPHTSPSKLPDWIVERVIELRRRLKRCAVVIHAHCQLDSIPVSLSSVKRIIERYGLLRPTSKWKRYRKYSKRPTVHRVGDLVQTDTIHFVSPLSKQRRYVYTVIDLRSRMAHARISNQLSQDYAVKTILEAERLFGFRFNTVQSDNGPEFGKRFYDQLTGRGIRVRHSRVRRPNDNAHIERFNRTLQDEALGKCLPDSKTNATVSSELVNYLDYYNNHRLHLSLQCKTPAEFAASVAKVVG